MQKENAILENNFLGYNLYRRKRIYGKPLQTDFPTEEIRYPELLFLAYRNDFSYNHVSLTKKGNWNLLVAQAIGFTLIDLLQNDHIVITYFEDEKRLINIFNWKVKDFHIFTKHHIIPERVLKRDLHRCIVSKYKKKQKRCTVNDIIHEIFDLYLGKTKEHNRPGKKFITELLKKYASSNIGLKIEEESKLLGLYKDYNVEINDSLKQQLNDNYHTLNAFDSKLRESSPYYSNLTVEITKCVDKEIYRREPKSDD